MTISKGVIPSGIFLLASCQLCLPVPYIIFIFLENAWQNPLPFFFKAVNFVYLGFS